MWGGEDKSESLSSFFDALTGTKDNVYDADEDISDQLAGFDARLSLAPLTNSNFPVSIYGQYVGEDEAG